jgi:hypothetical protein
MLHLTSSEDESVLWSQGRHSGHLPSFRHSDDSRDFMIVARDICLPQRHPYQDLFRCANGLEKIAKMSICLWLGCHVLKTAQSLVINCMHVVQSGSW